MIIFIDKWIKNIKAEGGEASGFLINAIEEGAIEKLIKDIEDGIGPINTLVYITEKYPNKDFALVMGGDNLNSFE